MQALPDFRPTMGALYVGCMVSVGLSTVVAVQVILYFRTFASDALRFKALTAWIWATDAAHTLSICAAIWQYGVVNYGNPEYLGEIDPAFVGTVILTGITTLNANIFYGWRIHEMSKQNWWLTVPIKLLCVARIALSFFISVEMVICKTWATIGRYQIILVGALAVSAATDIVISAARYYYLRELKQGYMGVPELVDAVVILTINDGLLSCAVVIASITIFLTMSHSFIWIGMYFTISKLYSNSVLATLNLRKMYCNRNRPYLGPQRILPDHDIIAHDGGNAGKTRNSSDKGMSGSDAGHTDAETTVQVFVDQRVEYSVRTFQGTEREFIPMAGRQKGR